MSEVWEQLAPSCIVQHYWLPRLSTTLLGSKDAVDEVSTPRTGPPRTTDSRVTGL
jgi:hypothetical protein